MSLKEEIPWKIVHQICTINDGWIVGSYAFPNRMSYPRDIDVWVPFNQWQAVGSLISLHIQDLKLTSFGGFRFNDLEQEIDIFTCPFEELLASPYFKAAWNPKTKTRIIKNE